MSNFAKYGIAGIAAFVMISAIWGTFNTSPADQARQTQIAEQNAATRAKRVEAAKKGVPLLVEAGLVYKIEPAQYRAYVNEVYWSQYIVDEKATAAAALGYYIQDRNSDTLGIDIYGARSGQKLGEWDDDSGFKAL